MHTTVPEDGKIELAKLHHFIDTCMQGVKIHPETKLQPTNVHNKPFVSVYLIKRYRQHRLKQGQRRTIAVINLNK